MSLFYQNIAETFPILKETVHGKRLVYLDHAATSLKPRQVVDRISRYYLKETANIHRGIYQLSEMATEAFEGVRQKVKDFITVDDSYEVVFNSGTTEGFNTLVFGLARNILSAGDEVIISGMEHHANIVPWQMLQEKIKFHLKVVDVTPDGVFCLKHFKSLLGDKTKFVSVPFASNVLGTINPIKEISSLAKAQGAMTFVDCAQVMSHERIDFGEVDCDFILFSAHKMYGPTGVGVLCGKRSAMEQIKPQRGGGDMIKHVSYAKTTFNELPSLLEAGTPNIAGVIGLGEAIDYLQVNMKQDWHDHEQNLKKYTNEQLQSLDFIKLFGKAEHKLNVFSFSLNGVHPHDIAAVLDKQGVATRAGHLCAMPLINELGVNGVTRASLGVYNSEEDIDVLVSGLKKVWELFS